MRVTEGWGWFWWVLSRVLCSYSSGEPGSDCVEVAAAIGTIRVRDSKRKERAQLAFTPTPWADFITYAATR
ncbi:DUF397 domain-containing protein [Streptomyces sp. NPDC052236]|uniref:DUF397 domain-containing protein n=1 Tax=Streptomyces sp. NPDC052236 TaxID=3365686 RepID=UPI0037D612DB